MFLKRKDLKNNFDLRYSSVIELKHRDYAPRKSIQILNGSLEESWNIDAINVLILLEPHTSKA